MQICICLFLTHPYICNIQLYICYLLLFLYFVFGMHEIFGISMAHPMDSASCNWMVYVGFPVPRRWWCSRTRDGGRIITSQYTGPCPFGPKIASEADQPRDLAGLAWTCLKCQTFCSLAKLMCFWAFLGDFPDFLFHLKFCHLSKCQAVGLSSVPGIASRHQPPAFSRAPIHLDLVRFTNPLFKSGPLS